MGTEFWKLACDENGIGGSGEYSGDYDSNLGRISVFTTRLRAANTCPARCSSTSSLA